MTTQIEQCPPVAKPVRTKVRQPQSRLKIEQIQERILEAASPVEINEIELNEREKHAAVTAETIRRPKDTWD